RDNFIHTNGIRLKEQAKAIKALEASCAAGGGPPAVTDKERDRRDAEREKEHQEAIKKLLKERERDRRLTSTAKREREKEFKAEME
ncbi:hypothetical protein KIPB_014291, partial [Kipferlia bialata]